MQRHQTYIYIHNSNVLKDMTEIKPTPIDPLSPINPDENPSENSATNDAVTTHNGGEDKAEKSPISAIAFDDFAKVELRIGKILTAETLEKSEKLLKLSVDFGEEQPRQVLSGIRAQFQEPEELVNRSFVFITNLEPRKIMGLESQAMIIAGKSVDGLALMTPTIGLPPGTLLS